MSRPGCAPGSDRHLISRPPKLVNLDLVHAHDGLGGSLRLAWVGVVDQVKKCGRHDLPRDAEPILEPPAWPLLPTLGQAFPVVVDLVLVGAEDLEGDGLAEGELGPAVEPDELLPVQAEGEWVA